MALVDRVAHRLPHEVRAERPHTEAVPVELRPDGLRISRVCDRPVDLEMVAPARELESVVAPCRDLRRELRERQIRPLAGEERDRTSHPNLLHDRVRLARRPPGRPSPRRYRRETLQLADARALIVTTDATIPFDPTTPEQRANPFDVLALARREQPVFHAPALDLWVVTRHEDVLAVLKDHLTFSSAGALKSSTTPLPPEVRDVLADGFPEMPYIIELDPPLHDRIRGLVARAFTPRRIAALEPHRPPSERYASVWCRPVSAERRIASQTSEAR